jgi:hypothetical protein
MSIHFGFFLGRNRTQRGRMCKTHAV